MDGQRKIYEHRSCGGGDEGKFLTSEFCMENQFRMLAMFMAEAKAARVTCEQKADAQRHLEKI